MRRFLAATLFFLSLFFLISFSAKPSYALCSINIAPNQFPYNYNGDITITSSDCSFKMATTYTVFAYPETKAVAPEQYSNYFGTITRVKPKDAQTISTKINLFQGAIGKENPGSWKLKICSIVSPLDKCGDPNNIKAEGTIAVGAVPTPTPPPTLPKIDYSMQPKCTFEIGEDVTLIVTNIQKDTSYHWWWNGDLGTHPAGTSDSNGSNLTFTIPGSETQKIGIRNVCVDRSGERVTGQSQQCISLTFVSDTTGKDTSCKEINSGTRLYDSSQNNFPNIPPPCAQWGGWNGNQYVPLTDDQAKNYFDENGQLKPGSEKIVKCISVDTAIGPISTEPQAFVRSIFNLVLGLAGGIALILIIISGYKFMASSGNPEAAKAATEQLTSAIIGLLFIIFAFVILQMIGVDILKIPGFSP